ncbi:hypothetical protein Pyn_23285 [Prunus yedoensis var. nudiflora]|uniref:Methylcrotonoyl-CoA carboxylase subunit alpha BT domain-containing protein n=1 Tax=Prunus yedoensis var. nudiflora TaxID=2094558 RepID=A0A315A8H2_PRUYE|nr:hypothetical protein Pyn_23285 [Prunus yedoensis var. nudiflora]
MNDFRVDADGVIIDVILAAYFTDQTKQTHTLHALRHQHFRQKIAAVPQGTTMEIMKKKK